MRRPIRGTLRNALLALVVLTSTASGQLLEHLEGFNNRLPVGDPSVEAHFRTEGPKGIVGGDFDQNGAPDFAVSNLDGTVTVYLNEGAGEFADPIHLQSATKTLREIIAADLTGNGYLDLAVTAPHDNMVMIFPTRGESSARRHLSTRGSTLATWPQATSTATASWTSRSVDPAAASSSFAAPARDDSPRSPRFRISMPTARRSRSTRCGHAPTRRARPTS